MTDTEKLTAFAKEVQTMLDLQKLYFKTSREGRENKATPVEVRDALANSKKQEKRVSELVNKVLSPQTELM